MEKRNVGVFFTLVMAIVLFSGVTHAATVVEKDGFTYKIKGDLQIQYRQDPNVKGSGNDENLDVEYDDLEIKNSVSYKIDNNLTAFGQVDFGFKNAADKSAKAGDDNDVHLEESYVGLSYKNAKVLVGKTDGAAYEFGVEAAYEEIIEDAFDEVGSLDGDDLTKIEIKVNENVTVVASHELTAQSEKSGTDKFSDVYIGAEFDSLEVAVAYQTYEDKVANTDATIIGASVAYDANIAKVGVDISKAEDDRDASNDQTVINAVVVVPVDKMTKVAAGYVTQDYDEAANEDVAAWYVNVTHKLHKNVHLLAEVTDSDVDGGDMGYLAGLRLKF